jgi:hypothetical protein
MSLARILKASVGLSALVGAAASVAFASEPGRCCGTGSGELRLAQFGPPPPPPVYVPPVPQIPPPNLSPGFPVVPSAPAAVLPPPPAAAAVPAAPQAVPIDPDDQGGTRHHQ